MEALSHQAGFVRELFEAFCTLGSTGISIIGALSILERARVVSLTTIVHHSLPTEGAKSVLGLSGFSEDDVR